MPDRPSSPSRADRGEAGPGAGSREARLAQKLRANLARRKQQLRAREAAEGDGALARSGTVLGASLDRDDPPA